MNGSTVDSIDKPKHDKIRDQAAELTHAFYQGEKLTSFESDIERMYISAKLEKHQAYQKRKSMRYKVRWTVSDLNKYQD